MALIDLHNTAKQSIPYQNYYSQNNLNKLFDNIVLDTCGSSLSLLNNSSGIYVNDTSIMIQVIDNDKPVIKIPIYEFNRFSNQRSFFYGFIRLNDKRGFQINKIKYEILSLQKEGIIENTLDYVFNTIDDLLIDRKFDLINKLFDLIEIKELTIETIVGLLTITLGWKDELSSRTAFFQSAYEFINETNFMQETNLILDGLD